MPLFSVGDCLKSIGRKLHGSGGDVTCEPIFSQALEVYNKINRLLMLEQETFVTAHVTIPVTNGCITLERRIKRILQARTGCDQLQIVDSGFHFMEASTWDRLDGGSCYERMTFLGASYPTYRVLDKPRLIFAVSDRPEEDGATLLVIGSDEHGNELRTQDSGKGIVSPINFSAEKQPQFSCGDGYHRGAVGNIAALRKPRTNGYVQVWGLDEFGGDVYWITTMAPDEESPSLTKYKISGMRPQNIAAEVSLQYVPLYDANEISLIQQPDAYELMAQGLNLQDAGDYGGYQTFRNAALSLVRKNRSQEKGTTDKMNISVKHMPMQGRSFSFRPHR